MSRCHDQTPLALALALVLVPLPCAAGGTPQTTPPARDTCASLLPHDRARTTGTPLEWKAAVASELAPGLRVYRASDRYPRAVFVDCQRRTVLSSVGPAELTRALQSRGTTCASAETATAVAELLLRFQYQPYQAEELNSRAVKRGGEQQVQVHYKRTTVWSPPGRPQIAGARATLHRAEILVGKRCELRVLGDRVVRVLRSHP